MRRIVVRGEIGGAWLAALVDEGDDEDLVLAQVVDDAPLLDFMASSGGIHVFYRAVVSGMVPAAEVLRQLDAIESVTFIGYPNGIWDSRNLLPVARRGTTATPLSVDFEETPRFLIDASVFAGSSGSPVFIIDKGPLVDRTGSVSIGQQRFLFVGVVTGVYYRTDLDEIIAVPLPTAVRPMAQRREMLDLGYVYKARTVVETVEASVKAHAQKALTS